MEDTLIGLVEWLQQGGSLLERELPLLAAEILLYARVYLSIGVFVGLCLVSAPLIVDDLIRRRGWAASSDAVFAARSVSFVAAVGGFFLTAYNGELLIKALLAPRLYLIEAIKALL